jgi:hypothetical protein
MLLKKVQLEGEFEHRDRNAQIIIESSLKYAPDVRILVRRERMLMKDGKPYYSPDHSERYAVEKKLSEIKDETVTLPAEAGGLTLTAGQIALAMELLTDKFAKK